MINITFILVCFTWCGLGSFNSHGTVDGLLFCMPFKYNFHNGFCPISLVFSIFHMRPPPNLSARSKDCSPGRGQQMAKLLRSINIIIKCLRLLLIQLSLLTFPGYANQCAWLVFKATEKLSILAALKHQCLISAKWQRKDNWHVCVHIN